MPAGEAPANKTKTKKLIIFGFFLINIQTGRAGSSTLEGERRKKKKTTKPNPTDSFFLCVYFSLCLWSLVCHLSEAVTVSHKFPVFANAKRLATKVVFVVVAFFLSFFLWGEAGHERRQASGKKMSEGQQKRRRRNV